MFYLLHIYILVIITVLMCVQMPSKALINELINEFKK